MNTTYPYLHQVFTDMIDLLYSNTFMAAQGRDALLLVEDTLTNYYGKFTLVIEGAVPTKDGGIYNVIARTKKSPVTALEAVTRLGPLRNVILGRIIRSFDPCISCATH